MSSPVRRMGGTIGAYGEYTDQGMITPSDFVDPLSGDLTPISFRFLNSMFNCIRRLEAEVVVLQQRLANAGIP